MLIQLFAHAYYMPDLLMNKVRKIFFSAYKKLRACICNRNSIPLGMYTMFACTALKFFSALHSWSDIFWDSIPTLKPWYSSNFIDASRFYIDSNNQVVQAVTGRVLFHAIWVLLQALNLVQLTRKKWMKRRLLTWGTFLIITIPPFHHCLFCKTCRISITAVYFI